MKYKSDKPFRPSDGRKPGTGRRKKRRDITEYLLTLANFVGANPEETLLCGEMLGDESDGFEDDEDDDFDDDF